MPETTDVTNTPRTECSNRETYWSDQDVLDGKLILMPTLRLAKLHRIEPDGRRVFITPTSQLVCVHGECSSTLTSWIGRETKAANEGLVAPTRPSNCDCLNTDGLYHTKAKPMPSTLPEMPASLFAYLEEIDTDKIVIHGRLSRHVPHTVGDKRMYLSQRGGHFVCKHAHSLSILRQMQKSRVGGVQKKFQGGMCDCKLDCLPQRSGLKKFAKLCEMPGKFGEAR